MPTVEQPARATEVWEPRPRAAQRTTLREDVASLWHDKRGFRVAVAVLGVVLLVALVGILASDDNDSPGRVQTGVTTSSAPLPLGQLPATTLAPTTITTVAATTTTAAAPTSPPTTAAPATTRATATTSAPATTAGAPVASSAVIQGVTAGAPCSPAGAIGITNAGIPMVCNRAPGEDQARWKAL